MGVEPEQPRARAVTTAGGASVVRGRRGAVLVAGAFAAGLALGRFAPARDAWATLSDPAPDLARLSGAVGRAAADAGIDPDLLRALVAAESGGDARARSARGAVGLTQLMPGTAADEARALGLRVPPDLLDPATNLRLGAGYLARLLSTHGGDEALALAGYNAGPAYALRWRSRAADVSGLDAVRREGFPATRAYVARVLRFREAYRRSGDSR